MAKPMTKTHGKNQWQIFRMDKHLSGGHLSDGRTSVGRTDIFQFLQKYSVYLDFFVPAPIRLEIIFKHSLYHGNSKNINSFEIGPKLWTWRSSTQKNRQTSRFIIQIQQTTVNCHISKTTINARLAQCSLSPPQRVHRNVV